MRYVMLACDYDGTLARDGLVDQEALTALERVRSCGRKLVLVTGRRLEDLMQVFPRLDLFDRVVAENGALLYRPATREEAVLCEPPPAELVALLHARGVHPLAVGRTIVATWSPHETTVLEVIRQLGLEQHVIFNKGAVMILPSGVNKASGLAVAMDELNLSPHNAVGIGDAENDHAFLALCECAVAVANAIPTLKERADWVTAGDHGAGVVELIGKLVDHDLADLEPRLGRHEIPLGMQAEGAEVRLPPYGTNVLLAGTSGSGKSTFATAFLERLHLARRQFCIIDPEGDYPRLEGAVVLGDKKSAPRVEEVLEVLARPDQNVVVNLLGVSLEHRPAFFDGLLPRLQEMRTRTGRPQWIIVDETHHLLPSAWDPSNLTLPQRLQGMMLITVHPNQLSQPILASVNLIVAIGQAPEETIRLFSETLGHVAPVMARQTLEPGEAIGWWRRIGTEPFWFRSFAPQAERRRHLRKYAEGELRPEKSFYFRGPEGKLNLRAQNLMLFLQLADGLDAETWLHHLRRGDYSAWFRTAIKDDGLAAAAAEVEATPDVSPEESRRRIREAIEERYTAPA